MASVSENKETENENEERFSSHQHTKQSLKCIQEKSLKRAVWFYRRKLFSVMWFLQAMIRRLIMPMNSFILDMEGIATCVLYKQNFMEEFIECGFYILDSLSLWFYKI